MTTTKLTSTTRYLCTCCLSVLANGDDSGCRGFWNHEDGTDVHPFAPCSRINKGTSLGILFSEHTCEESAEEVEAKFRDGTLECDCETISFSTRPCNGCGSSLHGERALVTEPDA